MTEFSKRLLSGIVYVSLLIFGIIFHQYTFLTIVIFFSLICLWEFQRLIHLKNYLLFSIPIIIISLYHVYTIPKEITWIALGITLVTQLMLLYDLLYIRIIPMFEKKKYIVCIFYLILNFVFLSLIPFSITGSYQPILILGMFILIWSNDSFAYLTGKKFGKHKLYSQISPKKTIEGFVGGVIFAIITSIILAQFFNLLNLYQWIIYGLIIGFFGTIGDLIQSKFKRQAGVKDSGTIMPGHGGIFDRLDSVLYASPFVFLFLQIVNYVS